MHETWYPLSARPVAVVVLFVLGLLIFHLVFVMYWKLGKLGWKYVDYFWLGVAAVGLLGASVEVRRLIAENAVSARGAERERDYRDLQNRTGFFTGVAVCRHFERTDFSPPNLDDLQREYRLGVRIWPATQCATPARPAGET